MRTTFAKFENIAFGVNQLPNRPKLIQTDYKIDSSRLLGYQFYFRYTGYVDFDVNKLALYKNISVLNTYYMRGEVLINPLNDFIYIGQRDYDSIKNGNVVSLYVNQIGDDPYGRLNVDLHIMATRYTNTLYYDFHASSVKQNTFETTSTGEIEFYIAESQNGVAVNTNMKHCFLYKFCNIDKQIMQYVETPYVFFTDGKSFMIDGDDIENGDDWDFTPISKRVEHIIEHGIDPITLQLVTENDHKHLRLFPGRYTNWLDWILLSMLDFDCIPVCIICGNTQYNTHHYNWNPISKSLINQVLAPELQID